jgi:4-hydroxybenzoate polyprenyltransferase
MKKPIALFDYVFLLRPTLFYPVWTFFLAGLWNGSRTSPRPPSWTCVLACLAALTALLGGIYIFNQIADRRTDKANGKLFLLANGIVSMRAAALEASLLAAAGTAGAAFLNARLALLFLTIFLVTGVAYNIPPFSWKNRPLAGLFTNMLGGVLIYAAGWLVAGGRGVFPAESAAYAFAVAAAYLCTTLPDMKGDRKTGKITFPIRYGIRPALLWSLGFEASSIVFSLAFRNWMLFIPALLALPFFIRAGRHLSLPDADRATKLSISALALSVCTAYPLYLIPVLGVFFLSKWYYRKRFGFNYPSLKSA